MSSRRVIFLTCGKARCQNSLPSHVETFSLQKQNPLNSPPPGSVVSREALAAAAAGAGAGAFAAPVGRIPRRSALRISAAEPHGGGGGGGGGSVVGVPLARQQQQQRQQALPPPRITQLTRLTLATGDPGEAAAVLGNRIGKAGGGGAGVALAAATAARSWCSCSKNEVVQ